MCTLGLVFLNISKSYTVKGGENKFKERENSSEMLNLKRNGY